MPDARTALKMAQPIEIQAIDSDEVPLTIKDHLGGTIFDVRAGNASRLGSRNFDAASGDAIGSQTKPAQTVASSGNLIGMEISPRLNSGIALSGSGSVIGLHVDAYLKGTAAGTVAGDVRGQQIELVTDDSGTRTVSGNVIGLRFRAAFSLTTLTGYMTPIKIEKAESQTNSKQWGYAMVLTGDNALIWRDDYTTEVTTLSGAIKVQVNGADRWIPLYSGAPVV